VERYQKILPKDLKEKVVRFDSTILTLSSKLLKDGFPARQINPEKAVKNQIKFAIGFNQIPSTMKLFSKSNETDEIALRQVVLAHKYEPDSIAVFDRGLASRATLREIDQSGIDFVTRLSDKANYRIVESNGSVIGQTTGNLTLTEDIIVQLRSKRTNWLPHPFRLVVAENEEGKKLFFLTNRRDLSAIEICEIYKKRWDIEIFFKFIKQELHAKHFLSRSLNGIQVTFYMILILSLLMMAFKYLNKLEGYHWVKWDFRKELRDLVNRDLVYLFDGNIEKYDRHFFGSSASCSFPDS
jgi:transposase